MKENESSIPSVPLSELITETEYHSLATYAHNPSNGASMHFRIINWVGQNPAVMERLNKHGLLLAYFAYFMEALLSGLLPFSPKSDSTDS